jgi:hypothetical protein
MRRFLVLVCALGSLMGCKSALEGDWQSDDKHDCASGNNDYMEFSVADDLRGGGELCGCDFDVEAKDQGGDQFDVDFDFHGDCGLKTLDTSCSAQGDELSCDEIFNGFGDETFSKL